MRAKRKPKTIDFFPLTMENKDEIMQWSTIKNPIVIAIEEKQVNDSYGVEKQIKYAEIKTLEGVMIAKKGDIIIRGIKGEIYPCKRDIFENLYEITNT